MREDVQDETPLTDDWKSLKLPSSQFVLQEDEEEERDIETWETLKERSCLYCVCLCVCERERGFGLLMEIIHSSFIIIWVIVIITFINDY